MRGGPVFCGFLELELLGLLPGEEIAAEVSVAGGLLEDGRLQLQVLDDPARPQVEVLLHDLGQLGAALAAGAVVEHGDGEGLGDADGVRDLDQAPVVKEEGGER